MDNVIPNFYDYAEPWRNSFYQNKTIPLCIDSENIKPSYPEVNSKKKIVFFHGLNRECFKGTSYINGRKIS